MRQLTTKELTAAIAVVACIQMPHAAAAPDDGLPVEFGVYSVAPAVESAVSAPTQQAESERPGYRPFAGSARASAPPPSTRRSAAPAAQQTPKDKAFARRAVFDIVETDVSVRSVLERWTEKSGYLLAWEVGDADWELGFGGRFGTDLFGAVDKLLDGLNKHLASQSGAAGNAPYLSAEIHSNGVLRVYSNRKRAPQ